MDSQSQTSQDKPITIAVPEDRVPEFYAFFARFLAAGEHGGRGPRGRRGPGHGRGGHRRCGHRDEGAGADAPATGAPATEAPAGEAPSEAPAS